MCVCVCDYEHGMYRSIAGILPNLPNFGAAGDRSDFEVKRSVVRLTTRHDQKSLGQKCILSLKDTDRLFLVKDHLFFALLGLAALGGMI